LKTREQTHAHAHTHARASSTETLLSLSLFPSLSLSLPMWHRRHFVVFQPLSLLLFLPGSRRPKKGEKGPKSTFFYLFFFFDLAAWRLKASNARQFNSKRPQFFPHFFFLSFRRDRRRNLLSFCPPRKRERDIERTRNFTRSADILLLVNSRRRGLNNASNKKKLETRFSLIF
jgi:hypothetical protein